MISKNLLHIRKDYVTKFEKINSIVWIHASSGDILRYKMLLIHCLNRKIICDVTL